MIGVALSLLLAAGAAQDDRAQEQRRWFTSDDTGVSLTLSSERPTYQVGEPVVLTLAFRNAGDVDVVGLFAPSRDTVQIQYRRGGEVFEPLKRVPSKFDEILARLLTVRMPVLLPSGEETRSDLVAVVDGSAARSVLRGPGRYEFKAVARPAPKDPDYAMVSNVVTVTVDPVPPADREAFDEYERGQLGLAIQAGDALVITERDTLRAAVEFTARHPDSLYAQHIRKALVRVLDRRLSRGQADDELRLLHSRLREGEPDP